MILKLQQLSIQERIRKVKNNNTPLNQMTDKQKAFYNKMPKQK
jgi:hypothetical protein